MSKKYEIPGFQEFMNPVLEILKQENKEIPKKDLLDNFAK